MSVNYYNYPTRVMLAKVDFSKKISNKKVLLRERKRHTACRVVSTPCVVLTGYPPGRIPPHPDLAGGVPYLGTPWQGTPHPDLAGGTLPGYPLGRVPPGQGTPPAGPGRVPPQVSVPWHSG